MNLAEELGYDTNKLERVRRDLQRLVDDTFRDATTARRLQEMRDLLFKALQSDSDSVTPVERGLVEGIVEQHLPLWRVATAPRVRPNGTSRVLKFVQHLEQGASRIASPPAKTWGRFRHNRRLSDLLTRYERASEPREGRHTIVYRVASPDGHEAMGQVIVVKVPKPGSAYGVTAVEAEGRAAGLLGQVGEHPYIVRVYQTGPLPYPHIEMEYMPNGTLGDRIADVRTPADTVSIVLDVARAVQATHGLRLYHNDVRPKNILFDELGAPKLADWGLSTVRGHDGGHSPAAERLRNGELDATYAAPEQLDTYVEDGKGQTDVYQLGLVLYDLLTRGRDIEARRDRSGALAFRPAINAEPGPMETEILNVALEHSLNKDPRRRISLGGFIRLLDRFADPEIRLPRQGVYALTR